MSNWTLEKYLNYSSKNEMLAGNRKEFLDFLIADYKSRGYEILDNEDYKFKIKLNDKISVIAIDNYGNLFIDGQAYVKNATSKISNKNLIYAGIVLLLIFICCLCSMLSFSMGEDNITLTPEKTIISTILPQSTNTPSPTRIPYIIPTSDPISEYGSAMYENISMAEDSTNCLLESTEIWQENVVKGIEKAKECEQKFQRVYDLAITFSPPDDFIDIHNKYLSALDNYNIGMDYYINALQSNDLNALETATYHFELGTAYLLEVSEDLNELNNN